MQTENLEVTPREASGSKAARRLRATTDKCPGILYGKGQEPQPIAAQRVRIATLLGMGCHVVNVVIEGAEPEPALFKEVQYDVYGDEVIHFDLARVSLTDRVVVQVPLEWKGEASGVREGGRFDAVATEVAVEAMPTAIPSRIVHDISSLELNDSVTAFDLILPEGVTVVNPKLVLGVVHPPKAAAEAVPEDGVEGETPEEGDDAKKEGDAADKPAGKDKGRG